MGLVLKRKRGESVQVGEATIKLAHLGENFVRLEITAPKGMKVLRTELLPKNGDVSECKACGDPIRYGGSPLTWEHVTARRHPAYPKEDKDAPGAAETEAIDRSQPDADYQV